MTSAAEAFGILKGLGAKKDQFTTRDSELELDGVPVQHAIDFKSLPALLVPLGDNDLDVFDSESKGIDVSTHLLPLGNGEGRFLIVRSLDSHLERQFFLLVDDMFQALQSSRRSPGAVCLEVLSRWRELFEANDSGLLSQNAQVGLLAELHLLERLAQSTPDTALARWFGPDQKRHDFVSEANSVEVKGTTSRDSFTVGIHGAKQLDDPAAGELWVYAEQMEAVPGGDSVGEAVERIVHIISDKSEFLRKLNLAGFRIDDSEAYKLAAFAVLRTKLCRVDKYFPRIVRGSFVDPKVIDRIARLEYSIDIGPVHPAVPDEDALTAAGGLLE